MGLRRLLRKKRAAACAAAAVALVLVFGGSTVASGAPADRFELSFDSPTAVAGTPVVVTIKAIDPDTNQPDPGYVASPLTFGGATASSSTAQPTMDGQPFGTATDVTFTAGTATATMVLYNAAETPSITVSDGSINNDGGSPITVAPADAAKLALAVDSSSPTAGADDALTITAKDAYGNTATGYTDGKTLTFGGAGSSPSGDAPTVNGVAFGSDIPITFASGVGNATMTLYKTGATTVTATDGTIDSGSGVGVTVGPAALRSFTWSQEPGGTQVAGSQFAANVTALDTYGNVKTDYSGGSVSGVENGPTSGTGSSTLNWSHGVGSGTFTTYLTEVSPGIKLTVSDGSINADSSAFTVAPGPIGSFSWTTEPNPVQMAGVPIAASVTAYDTFGNVKTDYDGSTANKSGLNDAPNATQTKSYGTWSNGVDNGPFVDYQTDNPTAIAFVDGSATGGTSTSFGVAPGPLAKFDWTVQPPSTQKAGVSFGAGVTAYDAYGNVKTDYDGTTSATFSGLHTSPNSTTSTYSITWSGGAATGTFTAYRTEPSPGTQLTVTDGSVSASSSNIVITPADLGSFEWTTQPSSPQVAGTQFHANATAYDIYGNVKTDYAGAPTFSGLHNAPVGPSTASYAMPFTNGVGSGSFTGYRTEPSGTTLVIADGSIQRSSATFNVDPADPGSVAFKPGYQPTETCAAQTTGTACASDTTKSAIINGVSGVRVEVKDIYGNLDYKTSVAMAIDPAHNPGGALLKGTLTQATDSAGVATFNDLRISAVGVGYELKATAPPTNPVAFSLPFIIAQTVTTCSSTSCPTSTASSGSTLTASATGTNLSGNTLGLALSVNGATTPKCGTTFGQAPGLEAMFVNVNEVATSGPHPNLTITWTIPKAIVQKIPNIPQNNNNGASHYDICLGSVNLLDPQGTHTQGFPTKGGGFAQPFPDGLFGVTFYWGVIPDCPKTPIAPCMLSRTKTPSGDLVLKYTTPYPWDPTGWAGGGV